MHEKISAGSLCFLGTSLARQAEYWRELKPRRISLLGPQLVEEGLETARDIVEEGGYQIETVVHPFLPGANLDPDPASWSAPRESLKAEIERAASLGAKSIYMTTGGHGGMVWEEAAKTFARAVEPCVAQAEGAGIALMIENAPFHNADIHIAHSLRDTITLAEMAGTGVCIDLFGCWFEAGLDELFERAVPRCQLVQVSDYVAGDRAPAARAIPGEGIIPLQRLLGWLVDAGYGGAFDLELFGPRIAEVGELEAARRSARRLEAMLEALGI